MPETVVAVDPVDNTVKLGQIFNISIKITDVTALLGFDFRLVYNSAVLQLVDVREGPFLKSVGPTLMINLTTKSIIWLAVTLYSSPLSSANGSGVLATATFKAIAAGTTKLDLYSDDPYKPDEIKLATDPPPDDVVAIPNFAVDGHVAVSSDPSDPPDPPADPPDPPATSTPVLTARAFAFKTVVGQGYSLPIEVTTANLGDLTENFDVASYANATEIGKQTLTLSNGSSTTTHFVWNTNGFSYGDYSVTAQASVSGKNYVTNDTASDARVTVTIPGDIKGDLVVDVYDAILMATAFSSIPGGRTWNSNADINNDIIVDIYDAIVLADHFEQQFP